MSKLEEKYSNHLKKRMEQKQKLSSLNFGYGMDGSIYHFDDPVSKTVPDEGN